MNVNKEFVESVKAVFRLLFQYVGFVGMALIIGMVALYLTPLDESDQSAINNYWPNIVITWFYIIFAIGLVLNLIVKRRALKARIGLSNSVVINPKKYTLHVFFPTEGNAQGDGILQAAGFKTAAHFLENQGIAITYHALNMDLDKTEEEFRKLIKNSKEENVGIILTMSKNSQKLINTMQQKEYSDFNPNMIITVASATDIGWMKANTFQYFISVEDEVNCIIKHFSNIIDPNGTRKIAFIGLDENPYSRDAYDLLKPELRDIGYAIDDNGLWISPQNDNHQNPFAKIQAKIEKIKDEIDGIIIVAFDRKLIELIASLCNDKIEYTKPIIATTTLTCPDWLQLLRIYRDKEKCNFNTPIYATQLVEGTEFGISEEFKTQFKHMTITKLKDYFENRRNDNKVNDNKDNIFVTIDPINEEVYKEIDINYISAFCYGTMRIYEKLLVKDAPNLENYFFNISQTKDGLQNLDIPPRHIVDNKTFLFKLKVGRLNTSLTAFEDI